MKKSSLFVLSVLATGLTLALPFTRAADAAEKAAQPEGGPREHLADRLKMLAEKLTLTDAQKASAGEVLKHEAAKLKALRDDKGEALATLIASQFARGDGGNLGLYQVWMPG